MNRVKLIIVMILSPILLLYSERISINDFEDLVSTDDFIADAKNTLTELDDRWVDTDGDGIVDYYVTFNLEIVEDYYGKSLQVTRVIPNHYPNSNTDDAAQNRLYYQFSQNQNWSNTEYFVFWIKDEPHSDIILRNMNQENKILLRIYETEASWESFSTIVSQNNQWQQIVFPFSTTSPFVFKNIVNNKPFIGLSEITGYEFQFFHSGSALIDNIYVCSLFYFNFFNTNTYVDVASDVRFIFNLNLQTNTINSNSIKLYHASDNSEVATKITNYSYINTVKLKPNFLEVDRVYYIKFNSNLKIDTPQNFSIFTNNKIFYFKTSECVLNKNNSYTEYYNNGILVQIAENTVISPFKLKCEWIDNNKIFINIPSGSLKKSASMIWQYSVNNLNNENYALYYKANFGDDWEYLGGNFSAGVNLVQCKILNGGYFKIDYKINKVESENLIKDIKIYNKIFTPNNDGYNDLTYINFILTQNNVILDVFIFDESGNLLKKLIENKEENSGNVSVVWDGKDKYSRYVTTGIYFLFIQVKKENIISSVKETLHIVR